MINLLDKLEKNILETRDALELANMENEELREENARLLSEKEQWQQRVGSIMTLFQESEASS